MIRRMALFGAGVFFLFFSCGSTNQIRDMGAPVGTFHKTTSDDEPIITEQQEEEIAQAEKEARQAEKEDRKRRRHERTDSYLGVVYTPEKKVNMKNGRVRVVLRGKTGSFNVYAIDEKGKETAIFSAADDSSSTYFSVLVGKREYRLNRAASIDTEVRLLDDGAQIAYTLPQVFQTVVDFSTVASTVGGEDDIVKISVYTTNLAENRQTLAIKALLDTVLGENMPYHFVTAQKERIFGEKQFTSFSGNRYFNSGNGKITAQFLVEGKTILSPQTVSFANRDDLTEGLWFPVIQDEKSFSNILAYSNSAMCINWPYFSVEAGETSNFTFYIAVATDEEEPKGLNFVDTIADSSQFTQAVDGAKSELTVKKPDADFVLPPITDDKLDPAYIQNLIDRINALNSDPKLVDRTEVRQLNAELDAILERIRQLNRR